jgi:hypothetical protein
MQEPHYYALHGDALTPAEREYARKWRGALEGYFTSFVASLDAPHDQLPRAEDMAESDAKDTHVCPLCSGWRPLSLSLLVKRLAIV